MADATATAAASSSTNGDVSDPAEGQPKRPVCVVVLGMAGAGKTSFVQRLSTHLTEAGNKPYVVNLDPAVYDVPFPTNIDIRDTVKYKEVMRQHQLGPNGAIMTSLNLFATRFDQVLNLLDKRSDEYKFVLSADQAPVPQIENYVLLDTPGQIEVFTWSASGTIITETLASSYPTVIVYVVDSARSELPVTFMSNMLYACSILYRYRLPFVVVFNKCDVQPASELREWLTDWEKFQAALEQHASSQERNLISPFVFFRGYMGDLTRSLSLVLDEFYAMLTSVEFSAATGFGCEQLIEAIDDAKKQYYKEYKPEYDRLRKQKKDAESRLELEKQREQLEKIRLDRIEERDETQQAGSSSSAT